MVSVNIKAFAAIRPGAKRRPPALALIAMATGIGFSALHMILPALPVLARAFDSSSAQVQLVVTLYFLGIAGGQLIYGPVSDRFGRRPVLIVGLCLFLAGTVLCGAAPSLPILLAGRVAQALGGCAGIVLGRAIIRDVYGRDAAASGIALVMMAMTLGSAVSPAVGAWVTEWFGWRAIFVLLGIAGVIVLGWTIARLAETRAEPIPLNPAEMRRTYGMLLRSRLFMCFALCTALTSASWFTFIASAPYLLSELLHAPPTTYGLLILVPMGGYIVGNAGAVRLTRHFGAGAMIAVGVGISLASGVMMTAWCVYPGFSAAALFLPMTLSSIGNGLSQPAALAGGLSVYPGVAGTASGFIGFLQMAVSSLGTMAVGVLPHGGPFAMVGIVLATQVLAFVLGALSVRLPSSGGLATPAARESEA